MGLSTLKSNLAAFKTGDSEFSAISTVNYFDNNKSGAKGFVIKANDVNKSNFNGVSANNDAYTYPATVINGRLMKPNGTPNSKPTVGFPGPQNYFDEQTSGAKGFTNKMYPIGGSKQDSQFLGINGNTYTYSDKLVNNWKNLNLRNDPNNVYQSYIDQPLILRGMQRPGELNAKPQRWGFGIGIDDGLIRGGAVTVAERTATDTERITKWLASTKGLLWIGKQVGLGLSNPKVETIDGVNIGQTRVHLGIPTLLSVAGSAFGLHFPSHGIPFATEQANYGKVQSSLQNTWNDSNRLIKLLSEINPRLGNLEVGNPYNTLSVIGGSRSVYGVGRTNINRTTSTTNLETSNTRKDKGGYAIAKTDGINSYITLAYGRIPSDRKSFRDFRSDIDNSVDSRNANQAIQLGTGKDETYYQNNNLETKYGLGKLGDINLRASSTVTERGSNSFIKKGEEFDATKNTNTRKILVQDRNFRGDRITGLDIGNITNESEIYNQNDRDFITFYFEDGNVNTNVMPFRATITGLTDTFSPGWEKKDIMGRPDGVYQYTNFERSISFEFKVYALSRSEMIPMWRKLNYLASYTMPDYGNGGRSSGPFMRLTLGDMYYKAPGFLSSLSYTIPDEGSWDIADDFDTINNPDAKQLPMYVDVSVGYTIIGKYRPKLMGRVYPLSLKDAATAGPGQWLNSATPAPKKANATKSSATTSTANATNISSTNAASQVGAPTVITAP
jgi:hypothetical protein